MAHENTYRDDNTYVRQILKKNAQYIFYLHIFIYLIDRERGMGHYQNTRTFLLLCN
jgi:hypothetical protein